MSFPSSFHDVRFPEDISFGSTGGSERRTEIITLAGGYEHRNALWKHSRRRYDAGYGIRSFDDISNVMAFFEARYGSLYAFRWRDWLDFKSCIPSEHIRPTDQSLGLGDNEKTDFQLVKSYVSGGYRWDRIISTPVEDSVVVAVDGEMVVVNTDFELDSTTGVISFLTPPDEGAEVTAGFIFDTPVRFATDTLDFNIASFKAGEITSIPVVEVRR